MMFSGGKGRTQTQIVVIFTKGQDRTKYSCIIKKDTGRVFKTGFMDVQEENIRQNKDV